MPETLYDIPVNRIDGSAASLGDYSGSVLLVVNVASECGLTPQYAGLERLYEAQRERGLVVLGFPANDFGAQEPGNNVQISEFCRTNYGVQFPMFEKISVKGETRHPLYDSLVAAQPHAVRKSGSEAHESDAGAPPHEVLWNFEKFLVARDGSVAGRFAPDVEPDDPRLLNAIDTELSKAP